jgi:predicted RNase H-like HicB family nuclease
MKRLPPAVVFNLKVEFKRGVDGRWIASIAALPGVTVSGRTRKQALAAIEALASKVLVDRLELDERNPPVASV